MTIKKLIKTTGFQEGDGLRLLDIWTLEKVFSLEELELIAEEMDISLNSTHGLSTYYNYILKCYKNERLPTKNGMAWIENDEVYFEW